MSTAHPSEYATAKVTTSPITALIAVASRLLKVAFASCALLAAACGTLPEQRAGLPPVPFADEHFGPPSTRVSAENIFAVSKPMREYLDTHLRVGPRDLQTALADALYSQGELKLEYESSVTRTAAEAFDARAGNCLSLVIMTAAFAKELGLRVRYQSAYIDEDWALKSGLLIRSGHVNITLGRRMADFVTTPIAHDLTIDFLPSDQISGLKKTEIPETLVVSMFMNNRAIESMVAGRIDDAYAWVRGSLTSSPDFPAAQNTLGLLYLKKGLLAESALVFEHLLAVDSSRPYALANLSEVRRHQGLLAEAERLRQRLAQIETQPPLVDFRLGLAAMKREDYAAAREHFAREAARPNASAQVRFWLGVALYRLGEPDAAAAQIRQATEAAATRADRDLYSAKLDWLRRTVR